MMFDAYFGTQSQAGLDSLAVTITKVQYCIVPTLGLIKKLSPVYSQVKFGFLNQAVNR